MSIRPIDIQVNIAKAQETTKTSELTGDKHILQEVYREENQKNIEKKFTEVNETSEMEKLDKDGHNKREHDYKKKSAKKSNEIKEQYEDEEIKKERLRAQQEYNRMVTNTGHLFDLEA